MKNKLTPEQSQRLIELGVDPSNASKSCIVCKEPYLGAPNRFCNDVKVPIFDLSDILSLLPKELCERINGIRYDCHLSMYGYNKTWGAMYRLDLGEDFLEVFESPELIDALHELLCWVLKNHPNKFPNDKKQ